MSVYELSIVYRTTGEHNRTTGGPMALIAGKSIQDNSMYRIYITIHFKDILTHVDAELLKLSDSLPHTHKHTHTHTHKLYSLGAVCFWKVQSTINITDTSSFLSSHCPSFKMCGKHNPT